MKKLLGFISISWLCIFSFLGFLSMTHGSEIISNSFNEFLLQFYKKSFVYTLITVLPSGILLLLHNSRKTTLIRNISLIVLGLYSLLLIFIYVGRTGVYAFQNISHYPKETATEYKFVNNPIGEGASNEMYLSFFVPSSGESIEERKKVVDFYTNELAKNNSSLSGLYDDSYNQQYRNACLKEVEKDLVTHWSEYPLRCPINNQFTLVFYKNNQVILFLEPK